MKHIATFVLGIMLLSVPQSAYCDDINDAVAKGDVNRVAMLIKASPELVNAKGVEDWVPLHYAVIADKNQYELVQLLLKNGADVNAKTKYGDTPLSRAAHRHEIDVARLLLRNKAEVDARDDDGWTPLHFAVTKCDEQMAALLLASKANPNLTIKYGGTALHLAIDCKKEMVELLLANNADVNAKDWKGDTTLSLATVRASYFTNEQNLKNVIVVLRKHGAREGP